MVELLAHERAHGVRFHVAWPRCMRLAFFRLHQLGLMTDTDERRARRQALVETREAWQRAYEGASAGLGEDFAERLVNRLQVSSKGGARPAERACPQLRLTARRSVGAEPVFGSQSG